MRTKKTSKSKWTIFPVFEIHERESLDVVLTVRKGYRSSVRWKIAIVVGDESNAVELITGSDGSLEESKREAIRWANILLGQLYSGGALTNRLIPT